MEANKKQSLTNFNYQIIDSFDKRCVDVKCSYKYQGKTLTHYFCYIKKGNRAPITYINRAKSDVAKIFKQGDEIKMAEIDLKGKNVTFFKRHKKPIIIITCFVILAVIATVATLMYFGYIPNPFNK